MRSEKGVTLIALTITIVVLIILSFTLVVNIEPYKERKAKTNFELDMQRLKEEISQYYARTKNLPMINRYTNLSMLEGIRNLNDNDNYYVIDINQLDVKLYNGIDYKTIVTRGQEADISDLVDVYIINEQSHTIYYPKGITYGGGTHYRIPEVYSEMADIQVVPYFNPYIPTGFVHKEGEWNNGFTIKGVTQNVNDEFVWVPCVLDQSKVKEGDTVVTYQRIMSEKYATNLTNMTDGDSSANEIKESVRKYGGFYIAKYEAGLNGTVDNNSLQTVTATDGQVKPLSQAGKGVWNNVTRADAITVSKAMINQEATNVKSTLISGEAWDTTLQWIVNASDNRNKEPNKDYDINSSGKGWYNDVSSNALHVTGYLNSKVNNIYDMAGNVWEWTTENSNNYIHRGGCYVDPLTYIYVAFRNDNNYGKGIHVGFRVVMYK